MVKHLLKKFHRHRWLFLKSKKVAWSGQKSVCLILIFRVKATIPSLLSYIFVISYSQRITWRRFRFFPLSEPYKPLSWWTISDVKYRRSPLPQGGLEIPIAWEVLQSNASVEVYSTMQRLLTEHYYEPEQIPIAVEDGQEEEDIFYF